MGVKKGQFVSKNGHTYEVRLSGTNVGNADILFGVPPIVISMAAGEHKFCGFKSTTAVVNILTDVPLIDLYASGVRDIRLTVEDKTSASIEFDGYVTPFAFDQPYTGKLDSVQVNAVDLITARKGDEYVNVGDTHGVDRMAIEILQSIATRSGLTRIVEHVNFNYKEDQGGSPLGVMVAQAGFLQDRNNDCDALSAICKFFGFTSHAVGDTLYLYDEHAMLHANGVCRELCNYYEYDNARSMWIDKGRYSSADSPLRVQHVGESLNDISISIERAYDGIQIKPEGPDVSVLLPDVCADENISVLEGVEEYPLSNDNGVEYRVERDSHVMRLGSAGLGLTDDDYPIRDDWDAAAVLMHATSMKRGSASLNDVSFTYWTKSEEGNFIMLRSSVDILSVPILIGRQWSGCTYSHTGGLARLVLDFGIHAGSNWRDITKAQSLSAGANLLALVAINCGGKRLKYDASAELCNEWVNKSEYRGATGLLVSGYELLPTYTAQSVFENGAIIDIPSSDAISVDIEFAGFPYGINYATYLISSLKLEGYGAPIDLNSGDLRYKFRAGNEMLEVGTLLTTRSNGVEDITQLRINARPGVVTDNKWNGSYMGRTSTDENIPIAGILMVQLKARYGQPHAAYKMTADGNIKPFAAVEWNGNTYTVDAYDRDIYDDTTTITID